MNELEIIQYPQIDDATLFLVTVDYRTPHLHREIELIWVIDGALQVTCQQRQFQVSAGEMVLFNRNQLHEFQKTDKSCTFICIQVSPDFFAHSFQKMKSLFFDRILLKECMQPIEYQTFQKQVARLIQCYLEQGNNYELYCVGQLHMIFYDLLKIVPYHILTQEQRIEQEKRNQRLERLLKFVDENYTQKVCLSSFAKAENRSLNYMSAFVKQSLGQTFQDYVNTVRFHCACKMIRSADVRLLDVCIACGFSDYRYFSQTFKKRLGITPEQYKQKNTAIEPDTVKTHHSVHTLEHFYTQEKSIELLKQYGVYEIES